MTGWADGKGNRVSGERGESHESLAPFVGRVLIVTFLVLLVAAIWSATRVFLLAFVGILLAILLHTLAGWVRRVLPVSPRWSLAIVVLLLAVLLGLAGWLVGGRLVRELNQLSREIPQSWDQLKQELSQLEGGAWIANRLPTYLQEWGRRDLISQFSQAISSTVAFAVGVFLVLALGIYFAADPQVYKRGVLLLTPPHYRPRLDAALEQTAQTLRWWIVAKLLTMALVGIALGVGLLLLGIPLALSLGFLAFLLAIIPNFGPVLTAIPMLLVAWTQGTAQVLWALLLYVGIQGLESYVLLPIAQQEAVRVPPALSILAIVLFGLLAGILGALVAVPLTVAAMVLIQRLYVQDVLGEAPEERSSTTQSD